MNNARALHDRRVFDKRSVRDQRFLDRKVAIGPARARACKGKTRFPSKKNAEARARAIGGEAWHAYRCPNCRRWHVGHRRLGIPRAP